MLADDRQSFVEVDVGGLVGPDGPRVTMERAGEEIPDQATALLACLGFGERLVEPSLIPGGRAPLLCLLASGRKKPDELLVTDLLPELDGVRDQAVVAVNGRERDARVLLGDVSDVAAEDGRVE